MDSPAYRQGRAATERRWRELAGSSPTEEGWNRFQTLIDECAFANLLKALNGDPSHPRVVRLIMPPHDWFGMSVPGSRFGGGPGADQSYAIIPVGHGSTRSNSWPLCRHAVGRPQLHAVAQRLFHELDQYLPPRRSHGGRRWSLHPDGGAGSRSQKPYPDQARCAVPLHSLLPFRLAPGGYRASGRSSRRATYGAMERRAGARPRGATGARRCLGNVLLGAPVPEHAAQRRQCTEPHRQHRWPGIADDEPRPHRAGRRTKPS